jgi:diaminohydroxyphosphoribosylaminopyrimidine deaminase/5-amino-6-(5-phosphoribosylamino)uracil reductase
MPTPQPPSPQAIDLHLGRALSLARETIGATAPNPPVGAVLIAADGSILAEAAHQGAGTPHAEAMAIDLALERHGPKSLQGATLYVTLEPCNHQGRTPPCTEKILSTPIGQIVIGAVDPNPRVAGGGAARLTAEGRHVIWAQGTSGDESRRLIEPFACFVRNGRPYVVHKVAERWDGEKWTMIPPLGGGTTFASESSLALAHLERRQSEAILTGMGTVLADWPRFNVRYPSRPDAGATASRGWGAGQRANWIGSAITHRKMHPIIMVVGRPPEATQDPEINKLFTKWQDLQINTLGHRLLFASSPEEALTQLAQHDVMRVLVEAGPKLSSYLDNRSLWDERLVIRVMGGGKPDLIERTYRSARKP